MQEGGSIVWRIVEPKLIRPHTPAQPNKNGTQTGARCDQGGGIVRLSRCSRENLIPHGTAFGILREQCSLVEPAGSSTLPLNQIKWAPVRVPILFGGEGGIRTHGSVNATPDFESGTFDHSATSPDQQLDSQARILPASPDFVQNVHMQNQTRCMKTMLVSLCLLLAACDQQIPPWNAGKLIVIVPETASVRPRPNWNANWRDCSPSIAFHAGIDPACPGSDSSPPCASTWHILPRLRSVSRTIPPRFNSAPATRVCANCWYATATCHASQAVRSERQRIGRRGGIGR